MLVLSRFPNERIIIGRPGPSQIIIEIEGVRGNKVRLGISADKSTPIFRSEVYDKIYPSNQKPSDGHEEREGGDDAA